MTTNAQNYLAEKVVWKRGTEPNYPYEVECEGERLVIRLNDFPDEPLYTLLVNDVELAHFDDWPKPWARP